MINFLYNFFTAYTLFLSGDHLGVKPEPRKNRIIVNLSTMVFMAEL